MSGLNGVSSGAPQPKPEFVVAALQEELQAAHANRLYLMSVIKQMQAEHEAEKASLLATIQAHEEPH